ncbi:hypothetical protein BGZ79_006072 [Entomortierella chlamydospora]|nr:hypothetical protein BGZ79_006072 [Entomortierella chlamydospora]
MATPGPVSTVPTSSPEHIIPLSSLSSPSSADQLPSVIAETTSLERTETPITQTSHAQQPIEPRPWWRPPARNFRPHPGNHAINAYITSTTLTVVQDTTIEDFASHAPSATRPTVHSERLLHYWFRALNYILRIPFREFIGNISRPYDPTAPPPLPDVPLTANIIDTQTNQSFTNPYTGHQSSATNQYHTAAVGLTPEQSTTRSRNYIPQIRKSWKDRTSDMSWALSTAFFTSVLFTTVATAALVLDWQDDCTYLKVFLIVFVIRKWIATFLMMDRALYRLPLGLMEPDPDIDDERHNGIAIYLSYLFTWHGYAMLFFGSFYVFFYGASHYIGSAPVITGVAIAFSCMGLVPFFALLILMLVALTLLYLFYVLFVCLIWPLEKCGLSRRRAISRRNGGYRSNGTTNTTDLREVERAIEDAENEESGGRGGFGGTDNIKTTPAMAAIPIVIFRKPTSKRTDIITCEVGAPDQMDVKSEQINTDTPAESLEVMQDSSKEPSIAYEKSDTASDTTRSSSEERLEEISGDCNPNQVNDLKAIDDQYVTISISSSSDSHNEAGMPRDHTPNSRSRSSSVSIAENTGSSWVTNVVLDTSPTTSLIPCVTEEMSEVDTRSRLVTPVPVSAISSQGSAIRTQNGLTNSGSVIIYTDNEAHNSNISISNGQSADYNHRNSTVSSKGGISVKAATSGYKFGSKSVKSFDLPKGNPTIHDEECAICLYDFEDGDELRHLYCDHFFHRSCVDRWLTKNPFCPKCKRGI